MKVLIDRLDRGNTVVVNVAVAATYVCMAHLSLLLAFDQTNICPVWPPSGLAFAAVLLLGMRVWPGILLGAIVTNVSIFAGNDAVGLPHVLTASVLLGLGNTLEPVLGRWLLGKAIPSQENPLHRVRHTFGFLVVTAVMTLTAAAIGIISLLTMETISATHAPFLACIWWMSNAMGILVLVPAIMVWATPSVRDWINERRIEALVSLAILAVLSYALFSAWLPREMAHPLPYMLVPLLFWIVFRYGPRLATMAILLVCLLSILGTSHGHGAFIADNVSTAFLHLQLFLGTITATALGLAASVNERATAEASLRHHRENLEKLVSARTEDLQRSNRELKQFASAASHDIQEPLRKVIAFGDRLRASDQHNISERGMDFLNRVIGSAQRMRQIIDDLLDFSRLSRGFPYATVDLDNTLAGVANDLELLVHEVGGTIEASTLPTVEADPLQMRQLLYHLVSNGLKFHRDGVPPIVTVRGRLYQDAAHDRLRGWRAETTRVCEISVHDNGMGFSERYAERIFDAFERLNDRKGPGGTGMGLALCRRIVSRHGGTITVESQEGAGSTFTVSLPAIQPQLPDLRNP